MTSNCITMPKWVKSEYQQLVAVIHQGTTSNIKINLCFLKTILHVKQGSSYVWTQPMRDNITMQHQLSLAKPIPGVIPGKDFKFYKTKYLYCSYMKTFSSPVLGTAQTTYILTARRVFFGNSQNLTAIVGTSVQTHNFSAGSTST